MNTGAASTIGRLAGGSLPLVTGLRACAEELWPGRERRALRRLARALESGASVEESLTGGRGSARELQELVREGARTGRLAHLLEEYLTTTRESRQVWREFFAALTYPAVISLLALGLMALLAAYVIAPFQGIFEDFGMELPGITLALLLVAEIAPAAAGILAIVLLAAAVLHFALPGRARRIVWLERIPLWGAARRHTASSEFAARLAVLVDAGTPLPRALDVLSRCLRDYRLRSVSRRMSEQLEGGMTAWEAAQSAPGMLPPLAGAFRWAFDPRAFAEGLRSQSVVFAAQARVRLDQLAVFLGPLVFLSIGAFAGFTVLGLFLPLVNLLDVLS